MNTSPYNLENTLTLAQETFAACSPLVMAAHSKCSYDPTAQCFTIPYLNQEYTVSYPAGRVATRQQEDADIITAILILHYLTRASGLALTDNWISFKELQGGSIYIGPFQNRAIFPFIKTFGTQHATFSRVATQLGGRQTSFGDLSYVIPVLPRVPVTYVLWQGDDEFPANGTILFDQVANTYLTTEDYAYLASTTVYAMIKQIKKQ
ncbi:MAG: DUF3786 domain-containing protein [Firmicutes bacterium]|nr:DUF3786 domain-containing protein [Bacillota bacterium]